MEPVFVSYRHGDSDVASSVLEAVSGFDCFVDKGISAGADWQEELREALASCKVFLVVVGNRWVEQRWRLEDPGDWVRKELVEVLDKRPAGEVVVIPILFNVTDEEVLTPVRAVQSPIKRLIRREAPVLKDADELNKKLFGHHQAKRLIDHKREIIDRIEKALQPAKPESQRLPRELVPYLCDRDPAERLARERFKRIPKPDFVVMHGYDREVHARFIDRLDANGELDKLFSSRVGVEIRPLPWGHDAPGKGGFAELIEFALEKQLIGSHPTRTLAEALKALPRPQVFTVEVTWADRRRFGKKLIDDLLSAFRETIVRLSPASAGRVLLWINVTYDQPDGQELPEEEIKALEALPRLEPIELAHFREWIALPEVKTYVPDKDMTKFQKVVSDHFAGKPLHMLDFADAVEEARASAGRVEHGVR